jgi:hypothetical protein
MRDAEYSGAVNVDHDGEKEKGSFEVNCSLKHMHLGLWRVPASSESVVARDVFGPVSGPTLLWSTSVRPRASSLYPSKLQKAAPSRATYRLIHTSRVLITTHRCHYPAM